MTTEYTWKKETILKKIKNLLWAISQIPIMMSYDVFIIKRKNWQTEKEWLKYKNLLYKTGTKKLLKQWYKKTIENQKKWNDKPHG